MDVQEAVRFRTSIRGYKRDPVPKEILKDILETAIRAPSSFNIQPWEFVVVTGEVLDNIRKANVEKMTPKVGNAITLAMRYEGKFRERAMARSLAMLRAMGIDAEDTKRVWEWTERGHRFFDAPAAIIVTADNSLARSSILFAIGAVVENICLAALNHGLGTCIEGQGPMFHDVIRKFTGLPESMQILIGIAIGYPDWDFPANIRLPREPVDSITTWCGFD
ncbi:MAG: nitroreductase [Chloroflexi bacterium]|nr:nitroreductase [Chloroflexota bacterium]